MSVATCEKWEKVARDAWARRVRKCADSYHDHRIRVQPVCTLNDEPAVDLVCVHHISGEEVRLRYFMRTKLPEDAMRLLLKDAAVPGYI